MKRLIAAASLMFLLSACGQTADLKPTAGRTLPVAPYGRADQPAAEELLEAGPQAVPERSVELLTRSQERKDDPFDLPPE
ncbi:MAG: membrane lipoprotein lipid attachment site-containing protein [Novosphingobium sp.]|nr:membrane lipoprotein lipid attachment site-containing protein [Novosphingobium sp.]MBO9601425.1 membrane lipoprotein lipid attachment site-containing protein [Novosphingobium sp.]